MKHDVEFIASARRLYGNPICAPQIIGVRTRAKTRACTGTYTYTDANADSHSDARLWRHGVFGAPKRQHPLRGSYRSTQ